MEDDQNNASGDASELSSDIATVRNDIAQLQNVGLTGQFYTSAQSAVSNDIAQANSVISEANQDSSNALTQGDAGFEGCTDWYPGSGSSPIQPLS